MHSSLVKKTDYNIKISEIGNEIATDHDQDQYQEILMQDKNKQFLQAKMILLIL